MGKVLVAIFALLLGSSFEANAITKNCNFCTQLQMDILASDSAPEMAQWGPLYVVDATNGIVRKYGYYSEWTGNEDDPYITWIDTMPVETNIAQGIAGVGGMIHAAGQVEIIANPNADWLPSDVYQAIRESHFQDDINNYIRLFTDADKHNQARVALNAITGNFFNPASVLISIKFVMKDGSYFLLTWDATQNQFTRVEGTERDSSGNKVPLTPAQIAAQTYVFPNASIGGTSNGSDDFYDMWQQLQHMGVTVVDGSYGQTVTYKLVMTCTPTVCSFYYVPM